VIDKLIDTHVHIVPPSLLAGLSSSSPAGGGRAVRAARRAGPGAVEAVLRASPATPFGSAR
jgi:hypothetical protein